MHGNFLRAFALSFFLFGVEAVRTCSEGVVCRYSVTGRVFDDGWLGFDGIHDWLLEQHLEFSFFLHLHVVFKSSFKSLDSLFTQNIGGLLVACAS